MSYAQKKSLIFSFLAALTFELEVTMAFPISTKSEAHDGPTDGQTCGVQQNAVS